MRAAAQNVIRSRIERAALEKSVTERSDVVRVRVLGHPGVEGGHDRDRDDAVREHEDQPRVVHQQRAGEAGAGRVGDVRLDEAGGLGGEEHGERPAGRLSRVPEVDAPPPEVEAEAQADPLPEEEQDEGLHGDAEGRAAGEDRDHRRRPLGERWPYGSAPNATMKTISIAIATTLFTTGAQVNGPNDLRAFSTSPSKRVEPEEEDLRQRPVGERRRQLGAATPAGRTAASGPARAGLPPARRQRR